jgi:hypothetical protein
VVPRRRHPAALIARRPEAGPAWGPASRDGDGSAARDDRKKVELHFKRHRASSVAGTLAVSPDLVDERLEFDDHGVEVGEVGGERIFGADGFSDPVGVYLSHLVQCLLFTLRILVVPPSGSIRSSSLKSTGLPFASSFAARFLVAAIRACCDDGIPHRAVASSWPSIPMRTIGAL